MVLATSIGITITEFWEITPWELIIALKGYNKAKEREADEYKIRLKNQKDLAYIQAYLTSRWVWQKKVDINKILGSTEKKENMTDAEMLRQIKALNAMLGGEVL